MSEQTQPHGAGADSSGPGLGPEPAGTALAVRARRQRRFETGPLAVLNRLRRHPSALAGMTIFLLLVLAAAAAPLITPYDPIQVTPADRTLSPSLSHPFGTDRLGRDIFSRVIYGARISLFIGFLSVLIGMAPGVTLGVISGYYGRWVDMGIMRFIDVMLTFPTILLALTIVFVLGPSLRNVMLAVGIASIPAYTRLVRGSVLSAREFVYVEAARVIGCRDQVIMFRHILPNVTAPVIVLGTLQVATAILSAAGLSFLGMGIQPPTPEWGAMLSDGRAYLRQAWWISTFPGVAIMVTVLAINLVGDGLRDALDARLKNA
jgi:peptide/nickel transport system permease protein